MGLILFAAALAVLVAGVLLRPSDVDASSHSAIRSYSQPWVPPGGRLVVTITATGYGGFGLVRETLPEGFSYAGSSLSSVSVTVDGQTASFVLLGDRSFTYAADAPDVEGAYTFNGIVKDADKDERSVDGDSVVRVGAEPTPTPTLEPTPTPEPTPSPTPSPTPTSTPSPTPTSTPSPTPTETPVPEPTSTPLPEPTPTATPEPTPSPTDTPTTTAATEAAALVAPSPTPVPESSGTSDVAVVIVGAVAAGVLLLLVGFLAGYLLGRRRA